MNTAKKYSNTQAQKVTTLETDAVDELMFEMIKDAPKFAQLCESDTENNSEGLVQDAFTAFYSHEPKSLEDAEPVQKGIVDTMMSLPEYEQLRASSHYDDVASALGAMQFAPEMIKQYVELKKKFEEKKKEAQKNGQPEPQTLEEGVDAKDMAGLRSSMRRALEQAQEEAEDYQDMMVNWGIGKGDLGQMPFEKRLELADRMKQSSRLKKVAELTGRFRNIVHSAAATTPVHGVDEVVDIGISNDISRMLPTELVKLVETPDLFVADYLENKLLTYNLKGKQDLGKGPIIAMLDNSGSMNTGGRIEWGVAVVLSLLLLAEKQNRGFGLIVFNDGVAYKKYWAKGTKISAQDKIKVAEIGTDGGTDFYKPLKAAFEFRKEEPALKPADFVMITDGECYMNEQQMSHLLEEKEKAEIRLYTIVIQGRSDTMAKLSNECVSVNNLGEMDTIKNLMQTAASNQTATQKAKAHQAPVQQSKDEEEERDSGYSDIDDDYLF